MFMSLSPCDRAVLSCSQSVCTLKSLFCANIEGNHFFCLLPLMLLRHTFVSPRWGNEIRIIKGYEINKIPS